MSQIFISFSEKDINFAEKIVRALTRKKLDIWIDWRNTIKEKEWLERINHGIDDADVFLFLISPDSAVSPSCIKELRRAINKDKRIIPIYIHETDMDIIPSELRRINWISCKDGEDNFNNSIRQIAETVRTNRTWLQTLVKLQFKALDWERHKRIHNLLWGQELRETEILLDDAIINKEVQITPYQRRFVRASRNNYDKLRSRSFIILLMASIGIGILGIYTIFQGNRATASAAPALAASTREAEVAATSQFSNTLAVAEEATAQSIAGEAQNQAEIADLVASALNIQSKRLDLSFLLSAEAYRMDDDYLTRSALLSSLEFSPHLKGVICSV